MAFPLSLDLRCRKQSANLPTSIEPKFSALLKMLRAGLM
jgi:hypothetical protein